MIRGDVKSVEVKPLCFNFGTLGHFPAHGDEDIRDSFLQQLQRMPSPIGLARFDCDINGLFTKDLFIASGIEFFILQPQAFSNLTTSSPQEFSGRCAFSRIDLANRLVRSCYCTAISIML